jgi:hypothetical protein
MRRETTSIKKCLATLKSRQPTHKNTIGKTQTIIKGETYINFNVLSVQLYTGDK